MPKSSANNIARNSQTAEVKFSAFGAFYWCQILLTWHFRMSVDNHSGALVQSTGEFDNAMLVRYSQ